MSLTVVNRIDRALKLDPSDEDKSVLAYIRGQITPEGQAARDEYAGKDISHLIEVANQRLRNYESKEG